MRDVVLRVGLFLQRAASNRLVGGAVSLLENNKVMDTFDPSIDPVVARTCILDYAKGEENHGNEPRLFTAGDDILSVMRTYMGYRCERYVEEE